MLDIRSCDYFSQKNSPQKMNGKVKQKIIINDNYIRVDGTCALYLYLDGKKKRVPLNIEVRPKDFNKKTKRVKNNKDLNIIIEKALSDINEIELSYRLREQLLTLETLLDEYYNPSSKIDFLKFYEAELENQKKVIKHSTYRQQLSSLNKLRGFKKSILFCEIDEQLIIDLNHYMIHKLKNSKMTTTTLLKNFKKTYI